MNAIRRRFQPEQVRELVLILLIIGIIIFFGTQIENYFSARTFNRISTSVAVIAVVAVGQTLVVLTRNIDLSVGSIVGFTAYVVGTVLSHNNGIPPWAVILMAVVLGALLGSVNGVIVAYGRVPSIIVTLGTLALYRTILVEISGANSVLTNELPKWLIDLPRLNVVSFGEMDVRVIFFMALLVVIIFQWVVSYLPWGRRLYAIGSNPDAARIAGFPAQRIVFAAFVLSGSLAGLAGFMFLARFGNITVVAGQGIELQSVAAAVVGGVSTNGGIGSPFGAFLGAILIDVLENSLIRWLAISEFWRDALLGLLILLAVATDTVIMNRLRKLWSQHELQVTEDDTTVPPGTQGDKGYAV
ncbi:MAG: ABC transporter permease [Caldilineaceae bacterium]